MRITPPEWKRPTGKRSVLRAAAVRLSCRGAILFEVILAVVLFAAAAVIISGGLNASMRSVDRLKLNAQAVNLGISVLSELQMGLSSPETAGPENFDPPFDEWTWEINSTPLQTESAEDTPANKVEIIIRHEEPPAVFRLAQILQPGDTAPNATPGSTSAGGAATKSP